MTTFALDLTKAIEKAKEDAENTVRRICINLFSEVVDMSPVGNPELWAINSRSMYMRKTHNLFVDAINADAGEGGKKVRRMGKKKLQETYKLKAGKGYVGGHFRRNWNISFNSPDRSTTDETDASGNVAKGKIEALMKTYKLGDMSVYLTNSLPYAQRLEEGWSEKQAPHGMVRVSIARFNAGYGA
jgi:hypothetical protein